METPIQQSLSKIYILIKSYYIILVFLLSSCSSFENNNEVLLARLGDSYLYEDQVTSIIKSYGGKPLIRGGNYQNFEGDNFIRTVVWEFPSYEKAIECQKSKAYQAGWDLAKDTTKRHMQVVEGFSTE